MFHDDEELARSSQIGVAVHATIGALAAAHPLPHHRRAADRGQPGPGRLRAHRGPCAQAERRVAGRQLLLAPAAARPSPGCSPAPSSTSARGRVDLLWRDCDDRLLIDEIKTGSPRELRLARTTAQVTRYLDCATGSGRTSASASGCCA